ncbi:MAG: putative manganese-dependent inorganic diphosphatase [Verrucomicrobiota bacterium]
MSETSNEQGVTTYVIGHKNPDTDAICSAIGYAELLRQTREPGAIAACCGPPNPRTEWLLQSSGIPRPQMLMDVRVRAGDVCRKSVMTGSPDDTVFDAYHRMVESGYRSMPVIDAGGRIVGMLSLLDLLELLIPTATDSKTVRTVRTTLGNIARALGAVSVHLPEEEGAGEEDYLMMVAASSEEVVAERMRQYPDQKVIVITGDRDGIQQLAIDSGAHCLVITGAFAPSAAILAGARAKGVAVLVTGRDTASTTQLIRGSTRIERAISEDYMRFSAEVPLDEIRGRVAGTSQVLFPVVETGTTRLEGVFSPSDLVNPRRPRLVLVDHNEFSQAVTGADEAEIVEVVDHHRLSGNLVTQEPVQFINQPVGSTCTIVAQSYRVQGMVPSKTTAKCLVAGIVSDTLKLTSPTTTDVDRDVIAWLSEVGEIDVDRFAEEFFAAGSLLKTCPPAEAVGSDRKEYEENGFRVSISQVEEIGLNHFWPEREQLGKELSRLVDTTANDVACLMVTDITRHYSLLLVEGPDDVKAAIDFPRMNEGVYEMEGVVSRKKQLFPWISGLLGSLPKAGVHR